MPAMGVRGRLLSRYRGGRFFTDGGRDTTALHLCSCGLGACEVPPADGTLEQAHLGKREPISGSLGMCPAHDAEQHMTLPPQGTVSACRVSVSGTIPWRSHVCEMRVRRTCVVSGKALCLLGMTECSKRYCFPSPQNPRRAAAS